jgi:murein DD-endopeptidase MepM/ murein hydrolase activator NlpD
MNSPYNGKFRVSQIYKGVAHDGLDLVGVDSKEIHSTVNGVVEVAGWENSNNKKQGFGLYVRIKQTGSDDRYYYGHMSKTKVKVGKTVKIGDVIGIEGSTGKSTGSHCHYCIRGNCSKKQIRNVNSISGIPNKLGTYDDGYAAKPTVKVNYYPRYFGTSVSIVTALNSLRIGSTFANRKKIANANGIKLYIGTAAQNTRLLNILKQGKLIKP